MRKKLSMIISKRFRKWAVRFSFKCYSVSFITMTKKADPIKNSHFYLREEKINFLNDHLMTLIQSLTLDA